MGVHIYVYIYINNISKHKWLCACLGGLFRFPEGPSGPHLRTLVPKAMPFMVLGPETLILGIRILWDSAERFHACASPVALPETRFAASPLLWGVPSWGSLIIVVDTSIEA